MRITISSEQDARAARKLLADSSAEGGDHGFEIVFEHWPVISVCPRQNEQLLQQMPANPKHLMAAGTPSKIAKLHSLIDRDFKRLVAFAYTGEANASRLARDLRRQFDVFHYPSGCRHFFDVSQAFNALVSAVRRTGNCVRRLFGLVTASLVVATSAGVLAVASGVLELDKFGVNLEVKANSSLGVGSGGKVEASASAEMGVTSNVVYSGTQGSFDFKIRGSIGPEQHDMLELASHKSEFPEVAFVFDRMTWVKEAWMLAPEKGYVAINDVEVSQQHAKGLVDLVKRKELDQAWKTTVTSTSIINGWTQQVTSEI